MKRTKWIALLLAVCLLAGTVPAVSAATTPISPAFTDIADPNVAESADLLRLLGIVNGTGGTAFRPQGTLTPGGVFQDGCGAGGGRRQGRVPDEPHHLP